MLCFPIGSKTSPSLALVPACVCLPTTACLKHSSIAVHDQHVTLRYQTMPTQEQRFTPFRTVGGRTSLALRPQPRTDCRALHKHTTSLNGITLCAAHSSSAAELLHQLARSHLCAPLRMRTAGHAARAVAAGTRARPPTMSCRRSGARQCCTARYLKIELFTIC